MNPPTLQNLADEWGVSKATARRRLKAQGLSPPRGPGRPKGEGRPVALTVDEVRALVEAARMGGWSQREAAERSDVHLRTLQGLLKRYEIHWWR